MKNETLALISEFDRQSEAESAGNTLREQGFDMGNVKIVGATWLDGIDPSGSKSQSEGAALGLKIAIPAFAVLGLIIGIIHGMRDPASNRTTDLAWPVIGMALLGAVLGSLLGSLFGWIGRSVDTPDWAETEYGNHLRSGAYLLLVHGDRSLVARAEQLISGISPVSMRVRPSKD